MGVKSALVSASTLSVVEFKGEDLCPGLDVENGGKLKG